MVGVVDAGFAGRARAGFGRAIGSCASTERDVPTWDDFFLTIGTKADRDVELTVVRDGREERITVRPERQNAI